MKKRLVMNTVFGLGIAALALRRQLYLTAVDEKGLLLRGHPLSLALLALTAAVLLFIFLSARKAEEAGSFDNGTPRGVLAALGHTALAGSILSVVLAGSPRAADYLAEAWYWLGIGASLCLLLAGTDRLRGRKPNFLLHVVPCLFFVVHIVSHYQLWSGNPQMQEYVFALLGAMALMFFGFYTAAMEAGCGSVRMLMGMGLAAVYLCLAEVAVSASPRLYLAGIFWVLADLYSLKLPVSAQEE